MIRNGQKHPREVADRASTIAQRLIDEYGWPDETIATDAMKEEVKKQKQFESATEAEEE